MHLHATIETSEDSKMNITVKPNKIRLSFRDLVNELKNEIANQISKSLDIRTIKDDSMFSVFNMFGNNSNYKIIKSEYFLIRHRVDSKIVDSLNQTTLNELDKLVDELSEDIDLINIFIDTRVNQSKNYTIMNTDYCRINEYIKPHIVRFDVEKTKINDILDFYNKIDESLFDFKFRNYKDGYDGF